MNRLKIFKGRHFSSEFILLCVQWYCTYPITYRNLSQILEELGVEVNYSTLNRWVRKYGPLIAKKVESQTKEFTNSWRVDEMKIKIKNTWHWIFRATDSKGKTIASMLSQRRNKAAVKKFFKLLLKKNNNKSPRVINVDGLKSYPPAMKELKRKKIYWNGTKLRTCKYLNNILESDHRFIKNVYKMGHFLKVFNLQKKLFHVLKLFTCLRKVK